MKKRKEPLLPSFPNLILNLMEKKSPAEKLTKTLSTKQMWEIIYTDVKYLTFVGLSRGITVLHL